MQGNNRRRNEGAEKGHYYGLVESSRRNDQDLRDTLEKSRLRGEEIVPTLAQRLIDEGRRRGMQQALMMQLSTRFQLNEDEKQFISAVNELEKLTAALKLVIVAQAKEEVLESLKAVAH
jgi:hypothetical protein